MVIWVLLAFLYETGVFFLRHYPFVRQTLDLLDYELAAGARQIYVFLVKIFELVVLMVNFLGAPEFCLIVTFYFSDVHLRKVVQWVDLGIHVVRNMHLGFEFSHH